MLIRPKAVMFTDGTFGIRKLSLMGYKYYDLNDGYWWTIQSRWFHDCKGDRNKIKRALLSMTDKGIAVPRGCL